MHIFLSECFISVKYVTLEERGLLPFPNSFQLFVTVLLVFQFHLWFKKISGLHLKVFINKDCKIATMPFFLCVILSTYTVIQFQKKDLEIFAQL